MPTTEITWVCCPAGAAGGTLRLAVVVVPRLLPDTEEATLAAFGPLRDWPRTVAELTWSLDFASGPAAVPAAAVGMPPDPALWRAVLPDDTPVRPTGSSDRTARPVITYPSAEVRERVLDSYAAAAAAEVAGSNTVPSAALGEAFDLGSLDSFRAEVTDQLAATPEAAGDPATALRIGAGPSAAMAQAYAFQQPETPVTGEPPPAAPALDVHQILTLLGDHPLLLRRLGLVVDLTVPADGLDEAVGAVRLSQAMRLPNGAGHHRPGTALVVTASAEVRVRARNDGLSAGVWPLNRPEYHLEALDVDGAVRRGVAVANAAGAQADTGLPSLRNDGIALVQDGRAGALDARLATARARRTAGVADSDLLEAEDLIRGFRVDVHDDADGTFRSLHRRRVRYSAEGVGDVPSADGFLEDEGFSQEALTGDRHLWVHERVVTWRGWSLSAPRPDAMHRARPEAGASSPALASLRARITAEVQPGTLPRLRFGHTYRLRLRTVDLAGQSVPLEQAPDLTTAGLTYRRYEPLLPPVVVSTGAGATYPEGETDRRMVIRRQAVVDGVLPPSEKPTPCERLLLPPRAPVALADQHGVFDDALGAAGRGLRAAHRTLVSRSTQPLQLPVGDTVPYLPDPQASGVVLTGLPGADQPLQISFVTGPDGPAPLRLRLETNEPVGFGEPPLSTPVYDEASRTLQVFLAPGQRRTIRVTSLLRDPDLMALIHDTPARRPGAERGAVDSRMRDSQHTMVTPYAEIELVHALPAASAPEFLAPIVASRDAGGSAARLTASLAIAPDYVDAVELRANWAEEADRGPDGTPATLRRSAVLFSHRLAANARAMLPAVGPGDPRRRLDLDSDSLGLPRHELGTTGHRVVTYTAAATTVFTDCYPPGAVAASESLGSIADLPCTIAPPAPSVADMVLSQVVGAQGTEQLAPDELIFLPPDPPPDMIVEPGQVRTFQQRSGGIRLYLERPWFASGSGEMLAVVVADPAVTTSPVPGVPAGQLSFDEADPAPSWVSQWGQDPTRRTVGVQALTPDDLVGGQTGTLSALPESVGAGRPFPVTLRGFTPGFEAESGRWFADIAVNADRSYLPFLRLAVVRWQPAALTEGLRVSPVTLVDFAQPLPSRTLTAVRRPGSPAVVTLRGTSYLETDPRLNRRVSVSVFSASSAGDQRWTAVPGLIEVDMPRPVRPRPLDALVLPGIPDDTEDWWTTTLSLPDPPPGTVYRLVVIERDVRHSTIDDTGPGSSRVVHVGTLDL